MAPEASVSTVLIKNQWYYMDSEQYHNINSLKSDILYDDVIKWKHFRVTGPLCGEFTGPRWIPLTKASDAELWCFL